MASLAQQIAAAPGQPSSVRIGVVSSTDPLTIEAQGTVFTDVGVVRGYTPTTGDVVALLGQSSASGSDPASWLCLGAVESAEESFFLGHQGGEILMSFVAATSDTQVVVFPQPFDASTTPNVHVNINSGAGATSQWHARAINISWQGFTMFVFGPSSTWTNIPVGWSAFPRTSS